MCHSGRSSAIQRRFDCTQNWRAVTSSRNTHGKNMSLKTKQMHSFWHRLINKGTHMMLIWNVAYVYNLVTLTKFLTCPLRCSALAGFCVLVRVQVEGTLCECVLDSGPQRAEDHRESTAASGLWKTLSQGQRESYVKHIYNICGWNEHTLTCCVSCWTESTGPEWSCVTSSMWMCVSRCMNVLWVVHCSVLNV